MNEGYAQLLTSGGAALAEDFALVNRVHTVSSGPQTLPDAPTQEPDTKPRPEPSPSPARKPDLDPFNPDWPEERPEPQPKA